MSCGSAQPIIAADAPLVSFTSLTECRAGLVACRQRLGKHSQPSTCIGQASAHKPWSPIVGALAPNQRGGAHLGPSLGGPARRQERTHRPRRRSVLPPALSPAWTRGGGDGWITSRPRSNSSALRALLITQKIVEQSRGSGVSRNGLRARFNPASSARERPTRGAAVRLTAGPFLHSGEGDMWPSEITYDAQYWQSRAEKARRRAEQMMTEEARREMFAIAAGYERLAQHAEGRTSGEKARR